MPFSDQYRRQVALVVETLPFVAEESCFALKGGTAINFFVRDLPRLSVDIDLAYRIVDERSKSLAAIDAALKRIAERIRQKIAGVRVAEAVNAIEKVVTKLIVRANGVQIKIEVTPVLRGCVYEPELLAVSRRVEEEFGFAEMAVVSFADLYGGKLVAALDRQHPRDLFDVRDLLANEGVTDPVRTTFIVYLLSHDRPMADVLAPRRKDITREFVHGFSGMTSLPVDQDELIQVRERTIQLLVEEMPEAHRLFLLSFERGEPDWSALGVDVIQNLPAVKWRQRNLDRLDATKRALLVARLTEALSM